MYKPYLLILMLIAVVWLPLIANAQECDTTIESKDTSQVYFFYHNVDSLALGDLHHYNMRLRGIHNYELIFKKTPFFASLGNPGLAYKDLLFNPINKSGFEFGIHSFDAYLYEDPTTEYYKLSEPFTELNYVLGPKKEQFINAKFHSRIIPQLTIGADFRYQFAPGKYQRQKSDNKSLALTSQFYTNSKRYGVLANFLYNKVYVYENGGITSDSLFEENIETDRFVIPVNLSSATNLVKQYSFLVNEFFNLQKENRKINDSTFVKRKFHAGRLTHSFNWKRDIQIYSDGDPQEGFYNNIYLDSTATHDSVYHFNLSNKLMWSNLGYLDSTERKSFYIYGAVQHQYHELGGYTERKYFNQIIPSAGIYWMIRNTFLIRAKAEFITGDYNGGDYLLEGHAAYLPGKQEKKFGRIELTYRLARQKPGWFYQQYSGNNFRWDNDLSSTDISQMSLYYSRKSGKAGLEYFTMDKFVTLGEDATPLQVNGNISILKAVLFNDFRFSIVGIDTKLAYQVVSESKYIPLPDFQADVAVFVTMPLFKGATIIQPGIEVFYNTSYYASAYMPALRSFYLQYDKEIGNFIYADIFFNFRIKRARMFLKYSHFNSLFGNYDYFAVPSYPLMDAGFRFGISWKFFD